MLQLAIVTGNVTKPSPACVMVFVDYLSTQTLCNPYLLNRFKQETPAPVLKIHGKIEPFFKNINISFIPRLVN